MQPKVTEGLRLLALTERHIAAGMWEEATVAFAHIRVAFDPCDPEQQAVLEKAQSVLAFAKANREHLRNSLRTVAAGRQFLSLE